jgi:hypothetical protein
MLIRYLLVPSDVLRKSLHEAHIDVDMDAVPVFLDDRPTGPIGASPARPHYVR